MPEAESFNALGVGNGFPFCLTKVDVSVYHYWTTLSGVHRYNPSTSDALIQESLQLAMKFLWNAGSLNCNATVSGTAGNDGSISTVEVNYIVTDDDVPFPDPPIVIDSGAATPKKRTCIPYYEFPISKEYDYTESAGSANARIAVDGVVAMYNGSTFVGYGLGFVDTIFQSRGTIEAEAGNFSVLNAGVYIGGYGYIPANTSNDAFDVGYVAFEGMKLFAYVEAKNIADDPGVVGSVNLSALFATCTFKSTDTDTATATASLNSIDFYTYPT